MSWCEHVGAETASAWEELQVTLYNILSAYADIASQGTKLLVDAYLRGGDGTEAERTRCYEIKDECFIA